MYAGMIRQFLGRASETLPEQSVIDAGLVVAGAVIGGGLIAGVQIVALAGAVLGAALLGYRFGTDDEQSTVQYRPVRTDGGRTTEMELIVAIVRPEKLSAVKEALVEAGAPSLTVSNVSGRGSQPAERGQWRGEEYIVDLHQKVKVECVVADVPADDVIDAIQTAAHTGDPGDGKIFVLPVEDACQVRTGLRGVEAI